MLKKIAGFLSKIWNGIVSMFRNPKPAFAKAKAVLDEARPFVESAISVATLVRDFVAVTRTFTPQTT